MIEVLALDAAQETFLMINPKARDEKSNQDLDTLLKELDCISLAIILIAQLGKTKHVLAY